MHGIIGNFRGLRNAFFLLQLSVKFDLKALSADLKACEIYLVMKRLDSAMHGRDMWLDFITLSEHLYKQTRHRL